MAVYTTLYSFVLTCPGVSWNWFVLVCTGTYMFYGRSMAILLGIPYTWTSQYKGIQGSIYYNAAYQGFPWYGVLWYVLSCTVSVNRGKAALYLSPRISSMSVRVWTSMNEYERVYTMLWPFFTGYTSMYEFVHVQTRTDLFEVSFKNCKQISNPGSPAYFPQNIALHCVWHVRHRSLSFKLIVYNVVCPKWTYNIVCSWHTIL
jgi:hypothetical protein